MSVPTNIDAASATPIASLPFSATLTQDDYAVSGAVALWWSYLAQAGDIGVGLRASASVNQGSVYPTTGIRTNPAASDLVTTSLDGSGNIEPAQWGLVAGTTYYFLLRAGPSPGDPGTVTMSLAAAPQLAASAGSIVIPDDHPDIPAVILGASGEVLRLATFPAGEAAGQLADGTILTNVENPDNYVGTLALYTPDLVFIGNVAVPSGAHTTQLVSAPRTGTPFFAVATLGTHTPTVAIVYLLTAAGSVTGSWPISADPASDNSLTTMAVSPDGAALYFAWPSQPATFVADIRRLDLSTGAETELVASDPDYKPLEIITLSDGSLVVAFDKVGGSGATFVLRRFSSLGVQQGTDYSIDAAYAFDHMAPGVSDPLDVVVWTQSNDGKISRFLFLNVSDWSDSHTLRDYTIFENGLAQQTTTQNFGPSASCPMFLTTTVPECVTAPVALTCAGSPDLTVLGCAVGASVTALGCGSLSLGTIGLIGEGRP